MVYAERGYFQREGKCVGNAGSNEQRAGKTGPLRIGDAVDVRQLATRLREHSLGQWHDASDVIARCKLGHNAAVRFVHLGLRMQGVREQSAFAVVECEAGLVAGSLDPENKHLSCSDADDKDSGSIALLAVEQRRCYTDELFVATAKRTRHPCLVFAFARTSRSKSRCAA